MLKYWECLPENGGVKYSDSYSKAMSNIKYNQLMAKPINDIDERSPWLTMKEAEMLNLDKYLGDSPYKGRKGVEPCGAKGIYLVDVIGAGNNNCVIIKNLLERSRLPAVIQLGEHIGEVEKDFIYPMVGGGVILRNGVLKITYSC